MGHWGQRDREKTGAGLYPVGPSSQHAEAAVRGHVYLDHPLVRPDAAPTGVVFAGNAGGGVWGYDLLDRSVNPGITSIKTRKVRCGNSTATHLSFYIRESSVQPKGYAGLPDNLLVDNLHQDGCLAGLYVGYALALMSLVDNKASKDLILSVRDDIRSNQMGHHYNDREKFYSRHRDKAYSWVEKTDKND